VYSDWENITFLAVSGLWVSNHEGMATDCLTRITARQCTVLYYILVCAVFYVTV